MTILSAQWGLIAFVVLTFLIPLFLFAVIGVRAVWRKFRHVPRVRARDLVPQHIQARWIEMARVKRVRRGLRRLWEKWCGGWDDIETIRNRHNLRHSYYRNGNGIARVGWWEHLASLRGTT